ncbi:glutaminase liver isoform, mitochondrial [Elysia marginata]|uniref:glutaminase n=1 Tax=Elysia marginata TaxID=1093978 RepID=A0AAV4GBA1_9GAST|nr:glutaminase liver isoform, mitochondrial [Elysia marginata]
MNIADKFDYNQQKLKQLSGNEHISFNNSVFLSERQTADRNFALGYYMKENQDLVRSFNFHNYDNLRHTPRKNDPRVQTVDQQANMVVNLIFSAYNGDVTAIRRCALLGMDMSHADYDGRTALHVAAAEGHYPVVQFLLEKCHCSPFLVDRWGFMPIDDAKRFQHTKTTELLHNFMEKEKAKGNAPNSLSDEEINA